MTLDLYYAFKHYRQRAKQETVAREPNTGRLISIIKAFREKTTILQFYYNDIKSCDSVVDVV